MLQNLVEIAEFDEEAASYVIGLKQDAPTIDPSLEWIWRAWQRLHPDRPHYGGGMGPSVPGRIPWSTVRLWCKHHGLRKGEMNMLDLCFGALDGQYLEWWQSKQKRPEP